MNPPGPFDGIRVLDLATSTAGAIASMYIADFGGDVVRASSAQGPQPGPAPVTVFSNRNKRITALDVTDRVGLRHLRRLASCADAVVIDRPRTVLEQYGLDAHTLRSANSQLVYVWMPPHAPVGRGTSLPADDLLLAARTGLADQQPGTIDRPVAPVIPHLSYQQGALGAIAIAAGLLGRQRTGLGGEVTVSGLHAVSVLNATILVDFPGSVRPFGGPKAGLTGGASFRMYQCRDGQWLFIAALGPHFFVEALGAMGLQNLLDLPGVQGDFMRTSDPEMRALIARLVEERMREKDRGEWQAILDRAGVPNAPVEQREDWLRSETVAANQGLVTRRHADLGPVVLPGVLAKLSATPGRVDHLADSDAFVAPADLWTDIPAYPAHPKGPAAAPNVAEPLQLPLTGLTVLDLGSFQAGPIASDILGDFGASVVKVEHPAGDGFRSVPSAYAAMNKGKRNLSIDLKEGGALNLLLGLVRQSDVVIDNARAGIPERLGTHYEALCLVNPDIVRCTILGWGEGALRESPSFDPLFQARSGLMAVQGAGGDPVLNAMPVHDVGVGTLGAFGVVVALFARRLIGRGQEVTTSLTHASLMQQAGEVTSFAGAPPPPVGGPDYLGPSPTRRLYQCQDGWVAVSAESQGAAQLCAALSDAPGGTCETGDADRPDQVDIESLFAGLTVEAVLDAMAAVAIPAVNVLGRNDVFDDGWLAENHFFAPVDDSDHGRMTIVTRYSDWGCPRAPERGRSHALGEDAEAILRDLDSVGSLRKGPVVR